MLALIASSTPASTISANVTLPPDNGQPLGTFFELVDRSGNVLAHAGASYSSGTFYGNQRREMTFYAANVGGQTWTDIGAPFPEVWTETRCQSFGGKLFSTNRDLPSSAGPNAATWDGTKWNRVAPPPGFSVFGGTLEVCGGTLSFGETSIEFDGAQIFELDTAKHHSMMSTFADGRVLTFAMGIANVSHNEIRVGRWSCGAPAVTPIKSYDGPSTGYVAPERNFPYSLLKASNGDGFLVATNMGDVYLVGEEELKVVHNWAEPVHPSTSWQPYTLLRTADKVLPSEIA
jgi:hypothetical protein